MQNSTPIPHGRFSKNKIAILAFTIVTGVPIWFGNYLSAVQLFHPLEESIKEFSDNIRDQNYRDRGMVQRIGDRGVED